MGRPDGPGVGVQKEEVFLLGRQRAAMRIFFRESPFPSLPPNGRRGRPPRPEGPPELPQRPVFKAW